jgi:hypothetical protein
MLNDVIELEISTLAWGFSRPSCGHLVMVPGTPMDVKIP